MTALLEFIPEQGGYGITHPNQVVSIELDGGPPRMRSDSLSMSSRVSATWMLDREEYTEFLAFWENDLAHGSLPVLVDLVTKTFQTARHKATFVPGSLRTTQVDGITYRISAELNVDQLKSMLVIAVFESPNLVTLESDVDELFQALDKVQIIGGQVSDGVNPPVNLDGIYTVTSLPDLFQLALNSPESTNADWSLLASYPDDATGFVQNVTLVRSPT